MGEKVNKDHETTHVQGGIDEIDSALDPTAIALAAQGEIPYRDGAGNIAGLGVGGAGNVLISGGAGANPSWAAAAPPGAHEDTHIKDGADDIDSALDARAVALANQGDIPYRAAAANTLAALAPGVAGLALLSGGAGANPSYGAPAPAAHKASHEPAGADEVNDIDIGNTGVLLSAHKARHEPGGVDTMAVDAVAGTGSLRTLGGGATQAMPGNATPTPGAHKDSHDPQDGADPLDAAAPGSINENANAEGVSHSFARADHNHQHTAALHENGGGAEISVAGLSGLLADGQTPLAHHTTHESGGTDETKDMKLDNALTGADNTGSGILTVDTVGETVAAGEVLYLKADGKYWKALATGIATMPGKVLAMVAITANNAGKLLHLGYFRHDAWNFVVGNGTLNLLYVSRGTAGLVTQTPPATAGDQVQVIGYCVTADIIFFNPCLELVEISA